MTNPFSATALGDQFFFNVGPKFGGSYNEQDTSVLKAIDKWNTTHPGILISSRSTYLSIEEQGKTMVDDPHIYMGVERWEEGKTITLRGASANSIESIILDGTDQAFSYTVESNDLATTLLAVLDDFLPVIAVKTITVLVYVSVGLITVTQGQTTIGSEHFGVFKVPTPKAGETQVIASSTPGDKRTEGASLRSDTTGFTDSYVERRITIGNQKIGGLITANLAAGTGTFTLEAGRIYRATLSYDGPYYALKGFGKNTKTTSVMVNVQIMKESMLASLDLLSVTPGEKVTSIGKDFIPDATILLALHSDLVDLGTVKMAADGTFTAEVTIPSDTLIGDHQLIVFDATSGESVSIPLAVVAPASSNPSAAEPGPQPGTQSFNDGPSSTGLLARTGSSALPVPSGATLAAGAGALLLLRKRTVRS